MINTKALSPSEIELDPREARMFERARRSLARLYGADESAFDTLMSEIFELVTQAKITRPSALTALDTKRLDDAHWFAKAGRAAYCTYIDRFSGTLNDCATHLEYLRDLGVGLFHPLPLLKPREGDNDGGFAVADYSAVDPRLGTFEDLKALATKLRAHDISLVLDVVCNHTAREHDWAKAMLAGDPAYKDFYIVLKDEAEVAEWSPYLSDVFPDTAPGSFSYDEDAKGWVWTTFYPFQWDLNYANPKVFVAMLGVLLDLANAGVEGFRLDSAAYLWKIKGTICRNLPQAHDILYAFRSLLSVAAPGVFLLAEAIEGLDEVVGYFGENSDQSECDLAYNNTFMTALWGSLAEGTADVATQALSMIQAKPAHGVWLNYVRCHDDIIWQALAPWVEQSRLQKWSDFYSPKSATFADGMAFQAPAGLAASTCGMAASLCGVGKDAYGMARLKLLYSLTYALDGVPMIYMGDEIALMNDHGFANDPEKAAELRWLHRPQMDWTQAANATNTATPQGEIFAHLKRIAQLQATLPDWAKAKAAAPITQKDGRILAMQRTLPKGQFVCIANFSPEVVALEGDLRGHDLISGEALDQLKPYQTAWYHLVV